LGRFLPRLGPFACERPFLFALQHGPHDGPRLPRVDPRIDLRTRSAGLTYAMSGLLRCNRKSLQFVRRTSIYRTTTPEMVSVPSLGVSSLDLGRSVHRAAPFLFLFLPGSCEPRSRPASRRSSADSLLTSASAQLLRCSKEGSVKAIRPPRAVPPGAA